MSFSLPLADLTAEFPRAVRQDRLVSAIRSHLGCGAVGLLKRDGDALCPVAVAGLSPETLGRRFDIQQHPRLSAILAQRSVVYFEPGSPLPDPYDGLLESKLGKPLPVHDCMGISLYQDAQCWGVLTIDSVEGQTFSALARRHLAEIGHYCEVVIRMCRLEDDIRALRVSRHQWLDMETTIDAVGEREIIGRSPAILQLLRELDIVADSELPVLLMGETGVGKELMARRVYRQSPRHHMAMVHVNCAALPESLAESELFGHVKGAFSGAVSERAGRFEAAHGGVLFLDEVGELPLSVQAKLLRVLQNGEIQRLGSDQPRTVDVRIIAATNRDLAEQVKRGEFRADLYHRLSVYPVVIPPLRERGDDVLMLAGYFLELNRSRLGFRSLRLSPAAELVLRQYGWPGNIRELEHVISRASLRLLGAGVARTSLAVIEPEHLALELPSQRAISESFSGDMTPGIAPLSAGVGESARAVSQSITLPVALKDAVDRFQHDLIRQTLDLTGQHWADAARLLRLDPSNLHKLAKRLGLK
jgi:anaerobic nitric oxide reductase transcription regulator